MSLSNGSKLDKNELKRLMKEEKSKRIDSPLAKYNSYGQLTCILCSTIIKSELYWSAHLNSKTHLEHVKTLKDQSKDQKTTTLLINSTSISSNKRQNDDDDNQLKNNQEIEAKKVKLEEEYDEIMTKNDTSCLPKGFFDDKTKDNKIRKVQRVDLDVEFKQFKKEIQLEENKLEEIEEIDEQDKEFDKELEECDELIRKWSKIEDLHKKKQELLINNKQQLNNNKDNKSDSSDESDIDIELDNVISLTLRAKNRC